MEKKKYLLLLTDFYPFEKWEPYLKHEMPYLAAAFHRIYIFSQCNKDSLMYALPANIKAFHLDSEISFPGKISSLRFLFSKIFRDEVNCVRNGYHLSFRLSVLKNMLLCLQQASTVKAQLEKFIREQNLAGEQLIAYSFWADHRALACAWLEKNRNIKGIARAHGWDVYFERHDPPFLPFRKFLHNHLAALFFVSENGRDYSLKKIPATNAAKFLVSKLGTPFTGRNPEAMREEFVIVTCSGIILIKRLHLVAEILSRVDLPVRWIHFGEGPLRESLLKKTSELNSVNKNFTLELKGDVENEELLKFYTQHHVDLFMLTSEFEGIPMSVMEAQSFGIPVMATNVGGTGELVNDTNGFLLEKNFDPEAAAEKVKNYFASPSEVRQYYRENAFNTWQKQSDAAKNYPSFVSEILNL